MLTHEFVSLGGWENNLRVANEVAEILITLDVGPRVLSFAPKGGENIFKVVDEQVGGTGEEIWQARGGHRFWIAPESYPFSYYPDNEPVDSQVSPNGAVTLTGPEEMPQGFQKQIDVQLHPTKAKVRIVHRLVNIVDQPQEVAAWMLSVMAPGGIEIIPQPELGEHPGLGPGDFTPNRTMVLWPFTNLADGRYHIGPKYITLRQDANMPATKLGLNHAGGWVGYWLNGTLFVKRFTLDAKATYPDRNCNFETFTNEDILEVESLGPLTKLEPGGVLEAVEEWELYTNVPAFDPTDDDSIEKALKTVGLA